MLTDCTVTNDACPSEHLYKMSDTSASTGQNANS